MNNTPAPYSRLIAVLLGILTTFVIGIVLLELKVVLLPFAMAAFISILLKPLVQYMRSKRIPLVIAILIVLASLGLIGFLFVIILTSTISQFIAELPNYKDKFDLLVNDIEALTEQFAMFFGIPPEEIELPEFNFSVIASTARTGLNTLLSFIGSAFLILLFLIFILIGSGDAERKVTAAFPEDLAERMTKAIKNIGSQVRKYLVTKTLVSAITGLLTFLVLWLFGVDFPLIWGFLTFLFNFIPNIGSMTSILLPFLLSLLQFDSLAPSIGTLISLAAVQIMMGNILEPRILGFNLNLSPVLILVSLITWGWLWGVWGMFMAVPLTATIKIVLENIETFRPVSVLMSGVKGLPD